MALVDPTVDALNKWTGPATGVIGVMTEASYVAALAAEAPNASSSVVKAEIKRYLNFPKVNNIIDKSSPVIHNGRQIPHVPYSDEVLRRAAYAHAMRKAHLTEDTYENLFESDGYKTMSKYKSDEVLALPEFKVTPAKAAEWDKAVTDIRNKLAQPASGSNENVFGEKNKLHAPNTLTLTTLGRYPDGVQAAVIRKRSPPYGMDGVGAVNYAKGRLSVSVQNGGNMHGGSLSAHAPLYPRVVMNGGAHPLAVLEGGGDNWQNAEGKVFDPVSQLSSKIARLVAEYEQLKGDKAKLPAELTSYTENIQKQLRELREKLWQLQNVNTALAAAPLGQGTEFNFDDLAQKGKEINEKAHKVSKGYVNLAQIAEHLEELVNRMKPAALKGGLHDALKH